MKEVNIISKIVGRDGGGAIRFPSGGSELPPVDLSDYLLRRIWDEVFELKEDENGVPYLFGKLPVVTQYGITMYADGGGVDVPGIYDGLPIDGNTLYWENGVLKAKAGTEGAITEITSGMVVEALGYTPAKVSDIDERIDELVNGAPAAYDTLKEIADVLAGNVDSIGDILTTLGNKADKATTLAGYGITDAYTSVQVDGLLRGYVTLGTKQTIEGEKNFTGGLRVNGSPIVYDATNKYWKLEGDLLVTGGVTMYGSDSGFKPSTIMDAIAVDGTTISKAKGYLEVIGGTGGGLTEVRWEDVIGRPTLLSSFTNDLNFVTKGNSLSHYGVTSAVADSLSVSKAFINISKEDADSYGGADKFYHLAVGAQNAGTGASILLYRKNESYQSYIIWSTERRDHAAIGLVNNDDKLFIRNHIAGVAIEGNNLTFNGYDILHTNSTINISGASVSLGAGITQAALRTALGLGSNAYSSTAYLPLTGGTLNNKASIVFKANDNYGASSWRILPVGPSLQFKYGNFEDSSQNNGCMELSGGVIYNLGKIVLSEANYNNYAPSLTGTGANGTWGISITGNSSSATKLQNARAIWGHSFNGTEDIIGLLYYVTGIKGVNNGINIGTHPADNALYLGMTLRHKNNDEYLGEIAYYQDHLILGNFKNGTENCGFSFFDDGKTQAFGKSFEITPTLNVSGATTLQSTLNVSGATTLQSTLNVSGAASFLSGVRLQPANEVYGSYLYFGDASYCYIAEKTDDAMTIYASKGVTIASPLSVTGNATVNGDLLVTGNATVNGDLLVTGGITMYSDIRKKTKLSDVELTLKQIADAPLIEHYYNSDDKCTTHVGSIAQYWAGLNDWFCKVDGEGYYTMEIQNAALASAISVARHLQKYESKTDMKIRMLKKRIVELEDKIEKLKLNNV